MALGELLKQARLEKGLSQRQLCGEEITRNMLSQIENGSAKPSMATLSYLAGRLGKPVSYFLEEKVEVSPNTARMAQARKAYEAGQYRQVCEILDAWEQEDDTAPERWLLETLSLMGQAAEAISAEKMIFAKSLLEKAALSGSKTPYDTPALARQRLLMLYTADPEMAAALEKQLPQDDRERYLRAESALQAGEYDRAANLLDGVPSDDIRWYLLRARAAMEQKDYEKAIVCYQKAEGQEPMQCAKALEQCYLALEDYKMAYHYACKQRNL